jgi:hypothetical protein
MGYGISPEEFEANMWKITACKPPRQVANISNDDDIVARVTGSKKNGKAMAAVAQQSASKPDEDQQLNE